MEARAIQRMVRQSPRKMRLVIDLIRGRGVAEAYAILKYSKKRAAKQIHKVLQSAVANAEQRAQRQNEALDVDRLRVRYAVVNAGPTLKRFTSAALGRATPILKRTSHVEIRVGAEQAPAPGAAPGPAKGAPRAAKGGGGGRSKARAAKGAVRRPAKTKRRKRSG